MKSFILLASVCLFGIASAAPVEQTATGLDKDLLDFVNLLPVEKFVALSKKYQNDPEFTETMHYLHSNEFAKIWDQLCGSQELRNFVYYLNDAGLHVIDDFNSLAAGFDLPRFPEQSTIVKRSTELTGGFNGYFDEYLELLPKEEIKALYNEKMENSKEFAELTHKIESDDFQKILKFVKDSPELTESFNKIREHGIEVDRILDIAARLYGWKQ